MNLMITIQSSNLFKNTLYVDDTDLFWLSEKFKKNILNAVEIELKVLIKVFDIHQLPTPVFFFNQSLSWKAHINHVKTKMPIEKILNLKILSILYCSLIAPYMYGETYKVSSNPVYILQKKATHILYGSD